MPSLSDLFRRQEDRHRTLFSKIKDQPQVDAIVQATQAVVGELDRGHTGLLFVALPGTGEDGHSRVHQALLKGAVAVLGEWPPDDLPENLPWGVFTYVHVLDVAKAWFWLCHNWGHLCKLAADPAHDHTDGPTAGLPDSALRR